MTAVPMSCPHCGKGIRATVSLDAADYKSKGPKPHIFDEEVYDFVIQAVDEFRVSFSALANLLEEKNIPSSAGGKRWYPSSARRLYLSALERKS